MKNNQDETDQFDTTDEKVEIDEFDNTDKIHATNPDDEFSDNEFADDEESGASPRQNYVTGIPDDEAVFERKKSNAKSSSGLMKTVAVTVTAVILIMAVALFFIFKGKSDNQDTASVKDNSGKFGINSNTSDQNQPNFAGDYQTRYGGNTNGAPDGNVNTAGGFGTVGSNITAPPPPLEGGIFQPQTVPVPQQPANGGTSAGGGSYPVASSGGRSSGGTDGGNYPKPVETTINPGKSTEIVQGKRDDYQSSSGSSSGGLNDQVSLYFYDPPATASGSGSIQKIEFVNNSAAVPRPNFGTVMPVKILGRLHTLGTGALARMELTRPVQGSWGTLPRGTLFVGRVSGGEGKRLFVSLLGYIDSNSNRLVTIGGDLQGQDGALGIVGDLKSVGSRWNKVFGELFDTAKQIGSAYLLGRSGGSGTVINNGQVSQLPNILDNSNTVKYVLVPAGSQGYIVINDLPPAIDEDEKLATARDPQLSDEDILKMIQTRSPQDVERIIPQLSPKGQQIARGAIR